MSPSLNRSGMVRV